MSELRQINDLKGKRILVTNDDGIYAPGLEVLHSIASELSDDVWVVAPKTEQSASGHSLSIHAPLRHQQHGERKYSVTGTPTDCVIFAHEVLLERKIDLVLSGVNRGHNLAEDITHSGTVAAAMEGTFCGVPSIAMSLSFEMDDTAPAVRWETPKKHGAEVVRKICTAGIPEGMLMNVNFPDCEPDQVQGTRMTHTGRRGVVKNLDVRHDIKGHPYYWIHWGDEQKMDEPGSDLLAIANKYISVSPINMDLTDYKTLEQMRGVMEV
ncbi:MAG: 5'/3'-nucleotidase SurE [Rickettsiales bacterium]|nr:5'/3'-nucleotidase SurE [Rickettsiales bacterium]